MQTSCSGVTSTLTPRRRVTDGVEHGVFSKGQLNSIYMCGQTPQLIFHHASSSCGCSLVSLSQTAFTLLVPAVWLWKTAVAHALVFLSICIKLFLAHLFVFKQWQSFAYMYICTWTCMTLRSLCSGYYNTVGHACLCWERVQDPFILRVGKCCLATA